MAEGAASWPAISANWTWTTEAEFCAGRVERMLGSMCGEYGLVMADPPYQSVPWRTTLSQLSERGLVAEDGVVVAEHRSSQPLETGYGSLRRVDSRRYGDTAITFYKVGENGG